jgi:hypothetical protein
MLKNLTRLALAAIISLAASMAAADIQQSSVYLKLSSILTGTGDLQTPTSQFLYDKVIDLANGTGADQANQVWSDTRTLTTGANETLDINGSLTNAVGSSVTFTKVKVILIKNKGTTTLSVGGAASNGFISFVGSATDVIKIPPGGLLLLSAPDATGFAATAATADQLKITNSAGASIDYDIVLIGVN